MGFLSDVVATARRRLERSPLDDPALLSRALSMPPPRPFAEPLRSAPVPAVIAEVKRSSPSAGRIAEGEPARLARAYEAGGAAGISVLTEHEHFDGALADLRAVHLSVRLPVLRKDFLVHPAQLIESRAEGADAVLLIAAALSEHELGAMLGAARDLGLDVLLETHSEGDLDVALATDVETIGVNARDLETLEVDVERAVSLIRRVPSDRIAVLESGISSRAQVERAMGAGARAVLVGEALMRAADPETKLRELLGAAS